MKINFKVRLKNVTFWVTAIPSVIALVYSILALLGVVPSITEETILNVFAAIISVLTTLGVITDPTTKGLGDSERALGYDKPYDDKAGEIDGIDEDK